MLSMEECPVEEWTTILEPALAGPAQVRVKWKQRSYPLYHQGSLYITSVDAQLTGSGHITVVSNEHSVLNTDYLCRQT